MESMKTRPTLKKLHSSELDVKHELVFAIEQKNLDVVESMLLDRSTPGSANYQKWLTFEEIGSLVTNTDGHNEVLKWLNSRSEIEIVSTTKRLEYIRAIANIGTWNEMFNTEFFKWEDSVDPENKKEVHRAEHYSIPATLRGHLQHVFNTVQAPVVVNSHVHRKPERKEDGMNARKKDFHDVMTVTRLRKKDVDLTTSGSVTVSFLNSLYGISNNTASPKLNQSVFQTKSQNFSQNDLKTFQNTFGLPVQAAVDVANRSRTVCAIS